MEIWTAVYSNNMQRGIKILKITGNIVRTRARAEAIAAAPEGKPPFLLLNRTLRVIYCNPGAEHLIAGESLLEVKKGNLVISEELQTIT